MDKSGKVTKEGLGSIANMVFHYKMFLQILKKAFYNDSMGDETDQGGAPVKDGAEDVAGVEGGEPVTFLWRESDDTTGIEDTITLAEYEVGLADGRYEGEKWTSVTVASEADRASWEEARNDLSKLNYGSGEPYASGAGKEEREGDRQRYKKTMRQLEAKVNE